MTDLNTLISKAGNLNYDALRDIRDRLKYDIHKQKADNAITAGDETLARLHWKKAAIIYRNWTKKGVPRNQNKQFREIAYPDDMQDIAALELAERETLLAALGSLIEARSPVVQGHKGTWQDKKKKSTKIVRDVNGDIVETKNDKGETIPLTREVVKEYRYLRVWVYSEKDIGNRAGKRRVASIYIGSLSRSEPKPFVQAVLDEEITKADIIAAFVLGGYEAVKQWRRDMDGLDDFGIDANIPDNAPAWLREFQNRHFT